MTTKELVAEMPRHLILVDDGASANVVMSHHSTVAAGTLTNLVMEIKIGKNARLHLDNIQAKEEADFLLTNINACQADDSFFHINTITESGGWVRNDLNIKVGGKNCETHLFGTYLLRNSQHVDNHTVVDHLEPHCMSNEKYKGILYDKSTGVFNGKVFVRQDAQKTNAFQQNANILMSDDATMNSKPELEIYADDVKCSHGSTTGQFDEEAIFYLKARGLSDATARDMLVEAFVSDIREAVKYQL
ncbi:MAG: Fe-S cluster assembly protein SufD [Flavobacteriales bacterium]|nr:Fe-S cluster assembly protein SufD [Flavobacteriales bacterium]